MSTATFAKSTFDYAAYAEMSGDRAKAILVQLGWFGTDKRYISLLLEPEQMDRFLKICGPRTAEETVVALMEKVSP